MGKPLVLVAALLGIFLLIAAAVYAIEPASSLPAFFPGHTVGDAAHHYKHAIGSLILGLVFFALAWFQSKPPARA